MRRCQARFATQKHYTKPALLRAVLFQRDENGSLIIFSLMMFVLMLLIAGISLDIERFETARTKLQNTADAAALAAASLTQEHYPKQEIVEDFFAKANMGSFLEDIDIDTGINATRVTVEADVNVPTHFFNMIGVKNLATQVQSVAAEAIGDVEVSMVLDVSGSMSQNSDDPSYSKMEALQEAGEDFIDAIYANSATGSVSINIVPYSNTVSAGPLILEHFTNRDESHEETHCLNFETTDYDTVTLDPEAQVEQTLHFDPWTDEHDNYSPTHGLWSPVCPTASWNDILMMSEDATELKAHINALQPTNWTSIELGVKWGAALLDPEFQPIVDSMIDDDLVGDAFAGRPAEYDKADGLKVIIVMTDGQNTEHYEMEDPYRSGDSFVYVYYDNNDRPYYSIWGGDGEPDPTVRTETVTTTSWECGWWYRYGYRWYCGNWYEETSTSEEEINDWYLANDYSYDGVSDGWRAAPYGGDDATRMTWDQLWAEVPVEFFTDEYLYEMGYDSTIRNDIEDARNYIGTSTKDARTLAICTAAKNEGVLVYSIGFEAPSSSVTLLQNCATTPSHFFDVDGMEISQAFSAIAADIARLRLLQ